MLEGTKDSEMLEGTYVEDTEHRHPDEKHGEATVESGRVRFVAIDHVEERCESSA